MYLKLIVLVLMAILGSFDAYSVQNLMRRRATKSSLIESSNPEGTTGKIKHYHYKPHHTTYPTHQPPHQSSSQPSNYAPLYPHPTSKPPKYPPLSPPLGLHPSPQQQKPIIIQPIPVISVVDQFDRRYPDGSYEFRYELPNETVRYERGCFISYHNTKILVVRGYYSYRNPDGRYFTTFFTADQNGYRQDSSSFSTVRPVFPRTLNIEGADGNDLQQSWLGNTNQNQVN